MSKPRTILLEPAMSLATIRTLLDAEMLDKAQPINGSMRVLKDLVEHRNETLLIGDETMEQNALMLLSVYDEIRLCLPSNWIGNIDFGPWRNIVRAHTAMHVYHDGWYDNDNEQSIAKGFLLGEFLDLTRNRRRKPWSNSPRPFDKLFAPQDILDLEGLKDIIHGRLVNNPLVENGLDEVRFLKAITTDPDLVEYMAKQSASKRYNTKRDFVVSCLDLALSARDALSDARMLIEYAGTADCEIFWPDRRNSLSSKSANDFGGEVVIVRAVLDGLKKLPVPFNAAQALKMRETKDVRLFWRMVEDWSRALRNGDMSIEPDIRNALTHALEAIDRSEVRSNRASLMGYAALAASVAELLVGAPPIGSLSLATVGAAIDADSRLARRRHQWFLWS